MLVFFNGFSNICTGIQDEIDANENMVQNPLN